MQRYDFITTTSFSITELCKKLREEFSNRLPQPMQRFSEIERWKKDRMNLVKIPSYVSFWLHDLLLKCDPILYPNIDFLLVFLATLSVATSLAERSFSALDCIKTYCRSTVLNNRPDR